MSEQLDRCFSTAKINGLTLRNRIIKASTFEGKSPNGIPGKELTDFHKEISDGGVGMTTIGYCAAESDGRVTNQMLYMHEGIRPQMEAMIAEIKTGGFGRSSRDGD